MSRRLGIRGMRWQPVAGESCCELGVAAASTLPPAILI